MTDTASSRPTRIVFVDHTSEAGGAELALRRLLAARSESEVAIVLPRTESAASSVFGDLPRAVSVIRTGPEHAARRVGGTSLRANLALSWKLLRSTIALATTRAARRSDVLIANTTRASVYVAAAAAMLRKPYAVHIRDLIEPAAIGGAATALMRRFVLPRASLVIANSHTSLTLVAPYLSPRCVRSVTPSPAGLRLAEPSLQPAIVKRIGMVARLDPWKGQELLIAAFAAAFPEGHEELVLYGGPAFGHDDFPERLRSLAVSLGVGERVKLAGHTEDVPHAIASLDICVQCSMRPEPLGQNVLQYLAGGKPTIVADEGGPAEWVRDGVNGALFVPRDANSLAVQLTRLAADPELRTKLALAAPNTPRLMSDQQIADEIEELVRSVVG